MTWSAAHPDSGQVVQLDGQCLLAFLSKLHCFKCSGTGIQIPRKT